MFDYFENVYQRILTQGPICYLLPDLSATSHSFHQGFDDDDDEPRENSIC